MKRRGGDAVRRRRLYDNEQARVYIHEQGGGVYEENELRNNPSGAWYIDDDSKDKVTRRGNIE